MKPHLSPQQAAPPQASPWLSTLALVCATALLFPLLRGAAWFVTAAAVVALITALHVGLRLLGAPALVAPLAELTLLVVVLVVMNARDLAPLGFVPGPAAMGQLRSVLADAVSEANATKPPADPTTGIIALVVLTIGALMIVMHALDEFGDPIGLGWPLLVLYAGAAGIQRQPIPWYLIAIAAFGWLALLAGRERARLVAWGRALDAPRLSLAVRSGKRLPEGSPDLARLSSTARRVGGAAVACALVVPLLLPAGRHLGFLTGRGSGPGAGHGAGGVVSIDPTVSLKRDLIAPDNRIVLTYTVKAGAVPYVGSPEYLRMDVLETFDGVSWTARPSESDNDYSTGEPWPLPAGAPPGLQLTGPTYSVKLGPLDGRALPIPPLAGSIQVAGLWFYDSATQTVRTSKESMQGLSYTVTTWNFIPTPAQLRAAPPIDVSNPGPEDPTGDLAYPANTPASIVELAHEVVGKASNAYDQAMAIQAWLRTFTYSTNVAYSDSTTALQAFLRDRIGYCQQFAATMALFARILGIPSRVAVGFAPGIAQSGGSYAVTVHDAHAWPELYFRGIGWVRFEPTPRTDAGTGVGLPSYAVPGNGTGTGTKPDTSPTTSVNGKVNRLNRADGGGDVGAVGAVPTQHRLTKGEVVRWLLLAALVLLLLVPVTRRARRQWLLRTGPDRFEAAWRELLSSSRELGRPLSPALTPRQVGAALRELDRSSEFARHVASLVDGLEGSRYARPGTPPTADPHERARHAVAELRAVRRALWHQASWATRIRALLHPSWS